MDLNAEGGEVKNAEDKEASLFHCEYSAVSAFLFLEMQAQLI
ncbi:MAG: hypothetical protein ACI8P0_001603 [Planctomycetaceae bacterium]|jgi:hypothetical protein